MTVEASASSEAAAGTLARWLVVDALVTGVNAVGYLALAGWLSDQLGTDTAALRWIGAFLLLFTALLVAAVTTGSVRIAAAVVVGNAAWVVTSAVVAGAGLLDLTDLGRTWALMQAVVVGALAVLQLRSLQRRARG